MKKLTLLKTILLLTLVSFVYTAKAQTNDLMPKTLRVQSHILFDKKEYTYPQKKEVQKKDFFIVIMEKILNKSVQSYYPNYENVYKIEQKTTTIKDIKEKMGAKDVEVTTEDPVSGKLIKKIVKGEYNLKDIKGIVFIDEWYFDAQNFTFTKKTIAYLPVYSFLRYNANGNKTNEIARKLLFVLNFENLKKKQIKKSNKRLVHYTTVQYEQKIFGEGNYGKKTNRWSDFVSYYENWKAPFLTFYGRNMLIETIFNKVKSGKISASDFSSKKKLTFKEIKERMGAKDMTMIIEELDGTKVEKTISGYYNLDDIKSYIFTEDWYLDPVTLRIVKKVRAIAPVWYKDIMNDNNEYEKTRKKILFEVKLN